MEVESIRRHSKWRNTVYIIPIIILTILIINEILKNSNPIDNNDDLEAIFCKIPKKHNNYCQIFHKKCNEEYFKISISYYCSSYYPSNWLTLNYSIIIIIVLTILIISLSILVSNYLIHNLNHLTKILKINNQILSFIIIPLTNCLPDLINYNITLRSNSVDLVLGQLIGSNLISFTLIIGLISFLKPFSIKNYKFILINFGWVLSILILFSYIISDGKITKFECILISIIFIFYLNYLIWYDQRLINESLDDDEVLSINSLSKSIDLEETLSLLEQTNETNYQSIDNELEIKPDVNKFIHNLQKIFNFIDLIIFFIIPLTIDYKEEDNKNHHFHQNIKSDLFNLQYFHIWYIIETIFLINYQFNFISSIFQLIFLIILIILLVEFINFYKFFKKSINQFITNLIGIINSLIIVSLISIQLLKILKNFGLILKISDYLLGLLIFSIINSINDVIMNVSLSINLNSILGINSCLGTPLLNILVGIGINGLIILFMKGENSLKFHLNKNLIIDTIGLTLVILFYLIYIPLNNWKFDKKLGILGLGFWIGLTTFNCMIET